MWLCRTAPSPLPPNPIISPYICNIPASQANYEAELTTSSWRTLGARTVGARLHLLVSHPSSMAETQGWTSSPDERGTLEILWSCLATMALCVWTAVHPNIPLVYSFWSSFFERLRLMFLAIIFPEFILTSAWDEQRQARALFSELKPWMGSSCSDKGDLNVSSIIVDFVSTGS